MTHTADELNNQAALLGTDARVGKTLSALAAISRLINAQLDPQDLCETVVRLLCQRCGYEYTSLYTVESASLISAHQDEGASEHDAPPALPWLSSHLPFHARNPASQAPDLARWRLVQRATTCLPTNKRILPLTRGVVARTARSGQTAFVGEVASDPDYFGYISGIRSEIAVPLLQHHDVLGVLNVETANRSLDENDLALLQAVGDLLVVALHNARLHWQTQRERDAAQRYAGQLMALHQVGHDLLTAHHLSNMLERITNAALELSEGVYASLHLPTADRRELLLVAPRSVYPIGDQEQASYRRQAADTGVIGHCFTQGQAISVADVAQEPRLVNHTNATAFSIASLITVPLIAAGRVIGVLSAGHSQVGAFTPELQHILAMLADQAAIAIQRAQLHQALEEALARANELDQLKDHVLLMASHELRTPLTAVLGFLELLNDEPGLAADERARHFLSRARLASEEMVLLLGNILDATRSEVDRSRLVFQQIEVAPLVERVLTLISGRGRQQLVSQAPAGLKVWADDPKVQQVLLNLLANAVKYAPPQSTITVEASCEPDAGMVRISVRDEGPGIALEDQPRLFQKFARLNDTVNSAVRGTGLGLYISRLLVESMNGQIGLHSAPGQGSTFWFSLPEQAKQ